MFKKKRMRIITICIVVCLALCATVWAKTGSEWIEIFYSDIKINVNGVRINTSNNEPFIYNGTTYLPVRAVAEALGQNVDWDGNTKTVSIGSKPSGAAYLMDVCPPYETGAISKDSFYMAGKKYSNGFYAWFYDGNNYFNLNGKYSYLNCIIGHVDGYGDRDKTVSFYIDGKKVKEIDILAGEMPKNVSVPLNYGLQLIIKTDVNGQDYKVGIAEITVE